MRRLMLLMFLIISITSFSQFRRAAFVSGPMLGHIELRTATIWLETVYKNPVLEYTVEADDDDHYGRCCYSVKMDSSRGYYIYKFTIAYLQPGTTYKYRIWLSKSDKREGKFTTQQLWQYRKPAPDFSFLAGSCAYFNQPEYDRPGKPYGSDSMIFTAMAKEKADFMLWLGDNWYTREVDYFSESGLHYRASHDRGTEVLQPLLKAMPHYAIWDDHDYGWNNAEKSYPLKKASRDVFMKYWSNPSYGENDEGIYTKMTWNDLDVFMLDSRYFRSNDLMKDSVDGKPNPQKRMFGEKQMEWLKNALLQSKYNWNISFRIIATGSQVLNPVSNEDCLKKYPVEYDELLRFIAENGIKGVVFLTGDRHHSEVIGLKREGTYPLYDITASSLTAGISASRGEEKNNPYRVSPEILEHNYARISLSGEKENRKMSVEFMNVQGKKIAEWSVVLKDVSR